VNILDENIPANQRQLLEGWRVHVRQLGFNLGRRGMQDEDVIPFLIAQRRSTFFTRDDDFYDSQLCHARYCLVYLNVDKHEVAGFARRFLRHPACSTHVKRMGKVIRVSSAGLSIWRIHAIKELALDWESRG